MNNPKFAFFGTAPLAVAVLEELEKAEYLPALIVAAVDTTHPRTKEVVFSPEKEWALARDIEVSQPIHIDEAFCSKLRATSWDFFIVASYGKILPAEVLEIPKLGVVNVHPSLLPHLRGPSPIRSSILNDEKVTGVSIMLMDEKMDHGPLLAQKKVLIDEWPPHGKEFDDLLAHEGAKLLVEVLPKYIADEIEPREQKHDKATFTKLFKKEDGFLDMNEDAHQNLRKIRAFEGWPGTFAYFERDGARIRASILEAHIEDKRLVIDTVIPEGKRAMSYDEFVRSGAKLV